MAKNLDKLLSTLERGPLPYTELQERSAIPEGSFSRTLGRALQAQQIQQDDAGRYRLSRTPYGSNHTSADEADEHLPESEGSTDGSTITDDGSDGGADERDVPEPLPKAVFRVPKRNTPQAGALRATITKEDGGTETISWEEHRARKGCE
jgi:hypothetical protein